MAIFNQKPPRAPAPHVTHFDRSMHAQAMRVPRLANIQHALASIRGAGSKPKGRR
jgi:hypothetical protein